MTNCNNLSRWALKG